jgi:hypothetical protein
MQASMIILPYAKNACLSGMRYRLLRKNFDFVVFNYQIREFAFKSGCAHDMIIDPMVISAPWLSK